MASKQELERKLKNCNSSQEKNIDLLDDYREEIKTKDKIIDVLRKEISVTKDNIQSILDSKTSDYGEIESWFNTLHPQHVVENETHRMSVRREKLRIEMNLLDNIINEFL